MPTAPDATHVPHQDLAEDLLCGELRVAVEPAPEEGGRCDHGASGGNALT